MKRLCLLTLVLLLGLLVCGCRAGVVSLERGRDLLKQGNYKEAIVVFTALVDKNAKDADAVEGLIRAQIETGNTPSPKKGLATF